MSRVARAVAALLVLPGLGNAACGGKATEAGAGEAGDPRGGKAKSPRDGGTSDPGIPDPGDPDTSDPSDHGKVPRDSAVNDPVTPATVVELRAYCDALCGIHCGSPDAPPRAGCADECAKEYSWLVPHARADILRSLATCYPALACSKGTEVCFERAGLGVDDPVFLACDAKRAVCEPDTYPVKTLCSRLGLMVRSSRAALAACYEKPCEDIKPCAAVLFGD